MLDHVGLQVQDVNASLDFYLRTFAPIGMREPRAYRNKMALVVDHASGTVLGSRVMAWKSSGSSMEAFSTRMSIGAQAVTAAARR